MTRSQARLLAQAAIAVYSREPKIEGYSCFPVRRDSTDAFVFENDTDLIVAFRGTDSVEDAQIDLSFWRKKIRGLRGTWHRGFVNALDSVYWQLHARVEWRGFLDFGQKRVWVTGHSLGGALAILFAARNPEWIHGVVTLGAPRVASFVAGRHLDARMQDRILQFENAGDQVTHVPMAFMGYRHVGRRVIFGTPERLWGLLRKGLRTRIAHKGGRYLRRVYKWEKSGTPGD